METNDDELVCVCSCSALSHSVRFSYWPMDDDDPFIAYVTVQLDSQRTFWSRVKAAWRHVFGSVCNYGDCAEVLLKEEDLPKVVAWAQRAMTDGMRRGAK